MYLLFDWCLISYDCFTGACEGEKIWDNVKNEKFKIDRIVRRCMVFRIFSFASITCVSYGTFCIWLLKIMILSHLHGHNKHMRYPTCPTLSADRPTKTKQSHHNMTVIFHYIHNRKCNTGIVPKSSKTKPTAEFQILVQVCNIKFLTLPRIYSPCARSCETIMINRKTTNRGFRWYPTYTPINKLM